MTSAQTICNELTRVGDIIVAARDLVADGQLINIKPLENEIGRICGDLGGLNATDAERVRPILLALIDDLDRLAAEMRARQSDFEDELRAFSTHSKATTAYTAGAAPRKK
jgi:hypothetical protein